MATRPSASDPNGAGPQGPQIPQRGDLPAAPPIPDLLKRPVHVPGVTDKPAKTRLLGNVASGTGAGSDMSVAIDFIATAAAGGLVGHLCDYVFKSFPVGLIIGLVIGFTYGTVRLIKRTSPPSSGSKPGGPPAKPQGRRTGT
jgi:F0F1-type ATP synthase assembly protein I